MKIVCTHPPPSPFTSLYFAQPVPFSLKRLLCCRFEFGAPDAQDKNIRPSFSVGFLKESFPEDIIKSNDGKSLRVKSLPRLLSPLSFHS